MMMYANTNDIYYCMVIHCDTLTFIVCLMFCMGKRVFRREVLQLHVLYSWPPNNDAFFINSFSKISNDGMAEIKTWHHNFQIVTNFSLWEFHFVKARHLKGLYFQIPFQFFFNSNLVLLLDLYRWRKYFCYHFCEWYIPPPPLFFFLDLQHCPFIICYIWYIITDSIRSLCITFSTTRSSVALLYMSLSCPEIHFFFLFDENVFSCIIRKVLYFQSNCISWLDIASCNKYLMPSW